MTCKISPKLKDHPNDRNFGYAVDAKAWKGFDDLYPKFPQDPIYVSLRLTSDGFNPF